MACLPAQAGGCVHLPGIEQGQRPARVVATLGEHRQQGCGIAHGQRGAGIDPERCLRIDAALPELHASLPGRLALLLVDLHVAQLHRRARQVEVALFEVGAAQGGVDLGVAQQVEAGHLEACAVAKQGGSAMADPAVGIQFHIAGERAGATQQPGLAFAQIAVVGGQVGNGGIAETQARTHVLAELTQAAIPTEYQRQVATVEQGVSFLTASACVEARHPYIQRGAGRRTRCQLAVCAGRTGHAHAGHLGRCRRFGDVHRTACRKLTRFQPQVGPHGATAVQLHPGLAQEQGGNPVERGEGPFALHPTGGALDQLAGLAEGDFPPRDVQVGIERGARTLARRQACLQPDVLGGVQLQGQRAAIRGAGASLQRHPPDGATARLQGAAVERDVRLQLAGTG